MDKNQIIGIVIIGVIIVAYMIWSQPSKEERADARRQDSTEKAEDNEKKYRLDSLNNLRIIDSLQAITDSVAKQDDIILQDTTVSNDSIQNQQMIDKYGVFAKYQTEGEVAKIITMRNAHMEVKFSTKGGRVYSVELNDYVTHSKEPLILFRGGQNTFNLSIPARNKMLGTQELFFKPQTTDTILNDINKTQTISFRLKTAEDKYIEYIYTLEPESFLLDYEVKFVNLEDIIPINTEFLNLTWETYVPFLEHGKKFEARATTLTYKFLDAEVKSLGIRKDESDKKLDTKVRWIAYKQQFFSSVLIAKNSFDEAKVFQKKLEEDSTHLSLMTSKIVLPYEGGKEVSIPMSFYFGPNKYKTLQKISVIEDDNLKLEDLIPLGWVIFKYVNKFAIIPLFNFLGSFIGSYGLIILIMTLLIKLVLFPLTYKSFMSSAKMRVLKPEIEKLNKKIPKEKSMERQQATMALYKKAGVNPMGGCLPVALQFPILLALFRFFPASIELRQESFLWATDLSSYDSIFSWTAEIPLLSAYYGNHISLFTLLMAAAIVGSTLLNGNQMQDSNPQAKTMKYMMYFMPVMMLFWFNNYSSGLSYYYLLSNLITIIQTLIMRKMIDEDKILAKLKANVSKNKGKKKTGFQARLEKMAKQKGYNLPKKKK